MEIQMGKIAGVFRVHDSLGVPRTRDADAKPTQANVQAFYTNALRSSGNKAEAIMRTKRMFDLVGLDVDEKDQVRRFAVADDIVGPPRLTPAQINQKNRQYWEPDKSGSAGDQAMEPPTEQAFNQGNADYVLTLPPGEYSAEDGDDAMRILRTEEGRDAELVATVPKGAYRIEADPKTGHQHLYRLPDSSVPERVPLGDLPIRVGDDGRMPNALRRMNERLARFYSRNFVSQEQPK